MESGQYFESHHIVPRSLGGGDERKNLICLTAGDHYFAHLLLAKMYQKTEVNQWLGVVAMLNFPGRSKQRSKFSSRAMVNIARQKAAALKSELTKRQHAESPDFTASAHTAEARRKRSDAIKKHFKDPEYAARHRRNATEAAQDPEVKRNRSESIRSFWDGPEASEAREAARQRLADNNPMHNHESVAKVSAALAEYSNRPEVIARRTAYMRENNPMFDPEIAARAAEWHRDPVRKDAANKKTRESHSRPEVKAAISKGVKQYRSQPKVKEKFSAQAKKQWENPEYKAFMSEKSSEYHNRSEVKAATSARTKKTMARPEMRKMASDHMKRLNADPDLNARRAASFKSHPDYEGRLARVKVGRQIWLDRKKALRTRLAELGKSLSDFGLKDWKSFSGEDADRIEAQLNIDEQVHEK